MKRKKCKQQQSQGLKNQGHQKTPDSDSLKCTNQGPPLLNILNTHLMETFLRSRNLPTPLLSALGLASVSSFFLFPPRSSAASAASASASAARSDASFAQMPRERVRDEAANIDFHHHLFILTVVARTVHVPRV